MKIKLSSLVTALSGKLSGQFASSDNSGLHLRNASNFIRKSTTRQIVIRRGNNSILLLWRNLGASQRKRWLSLSIGGRVGFHAFVFVNKPISFLGLSLLANPPLFSGVKVSRLISVSVFFSNSNVNVIFSPTVNDSTYMRIYASQPVSPGKVLRSDKCQWLVNFIPNRTSPINIQPSYIAKYGSVGRRGSLIWFYADCVNRFSGEVSPKQGISAIVV